MAAAEAHAPASFTMHPVDEYKLLLASICPFLFSIEVLLVHTSLPSLNFCWLRDFQVIYVSTCLARVNKMC